MARPIRIKSLGNLSAQSSSPQRSSSRAPTPRLIDCSRLEVPHGNFPSKVSAHELFLTLPIPPSINHQYATVNGRRILSSKGRHYKTTVAQSIMSTLASSPLRPVLLDNLHTHALILSVWFYFTSALRRDLDGGLKIAQDAICSAMEINDNRISELHLYKAIDVDAPRMECTLSVVQTSPLPRKKTNSKLRSKASTRQISSRFNGLKP